MTDVDAKFADHDRRIDQLEKDTLRIQARLGELERDKKLIRDLAQTTRDLGNRIKELADGVEAIAERAVEVVLDRRREKQLARWKVYAGWLTGAAAAAAFVIDHTHLAHLLGAG